MNIFSSENLKSSSFSLRVNCKCLLLSLGAAQGFHLNVIVVAVRCSGW